MSTITVQDAQSDFSAVLARVAAGESLVLTDQDKPVAEIKPVPQPAKKRRQFGLSKGEFVVPDDFMHAFADDIADEFEGKYSTFISFCGLSLATRDCRRSFVRRLKIQQAPCF